MNINDFNIAPNIVYFIKLINDGADFSIEIYKTEADATSSTNRIAYSTNNIFGSDTEISLINDTTYPTISKFNRDLDYYLKINYGSGDPNATFKIGPFYDLQVNDELINSSAQQLARSTYEINKGTHSIIRKSITLEHSSSRVDGNIVTLDTDDFSSEDNKILSTQINWSNNSLVDNILVYTYEDLNLYSP